MTAIIGVDVGVTTGVGWGWYNPALRDRAGIWTALARGRRTGWAEVRPYKSPAIGHEVCRVVAERIAIWNMGGLDLREILICIEDFQVRRDLRGATGQDKLAPVFIAGSLVETLVMAGYENQIEFISASTSKSFCSDKRLKEWGKRTAGRMGWIRGKKHARDACRLIAVGLEQVV